MISIIVPVYNAEKYLRRCLDSIMAQTYKDFEAILINDGSKDSSYEICKEYADRDSRFVLIDKENEGAGITRNRGLEKAVGDYIGFVDSDDYIDPYMYEDLYRLITDNEADLVYCNYTNEFNHKERTGKYRSYDEDGVKNIIIGEIGTQPWEKADALYGSGTCRGFYRRSIIYDHSIRFRSERLYGSEDLIFNVEYLLNCKKVIYLSDSPYHYCLNMSSMTHTFGHFKLENELRLYNTIDQIMKTANITGYELPLKRMLIKRIRCGIINYSKACTFKNIRDAYNEVDQLLNNKEVIKILEEYPGNRLPFKKRVFYYAMKKQRILECLLLGKC